MQFLLVIFIFTSPLQAFSLFSNPKKEMAAWYDLLIAREAVNRTREAAIKAANDPKLKELREKAYKASQELDQKTYEAHKFFQEGLKELNLKIDILRRRLKNQLADQALANVQKKSAENLNGLLNKIDKWTFEFSKKLTNIIREYTQANVQGKSGQLESVKAAIQELEREIGEKEKESETLVLSLAAKQECQQIFQKWEEIGKKLINLKKDISMITQVNLSSFNSQATQQLDVLKKAIGPVKCKGISTIADVSDQNMIACAVSKITSEIKMLDLPVCKSLEIESVSKKRTVSSDKTLIEYRNCIGGYINKRWPY